MKMVKTTLKAIFLSVCGAALIFGGWYVYEPDQITKLEIGVGQAMLTGCAMADEGGTTFGMLSFTQGKTRYTLPVACKAEPIEQQQATQ